MQRRIKIAVIVSIVATIVTTARAHSVVDRTAPIGLAHSSDIELRVIEPIKIDVRIVDVIDRVRVVIEARETLTARCQRNQRYC